MPVECGTPPTPLDAHAPRRRAQLPPLTPDLLKAVADALGVIAYEARARLALPEAPVILASLADAAAAADMRAAVSQAGLDVFTLDMACAPTHRFVARRVHLGDEARFTDRAGMEYAVPWSQLRLILRVTGIVIGEATEVQTGRKLAAGRALMTGGLMMTKKTTRTTTRATQDYQPFLYVEADGAAPIIIREAEVLFDGPGTPAQPTRQAAFMHILQRLRAAAPQAVFDDRLMRKAAQARLLGRALSPEAHLDVAIAVLARALR